MKIGWGKREYSMDVPANLFGQMHMRVAEGILDPLCVTVLLLEGEDKALFISVDTEGVPNVLMDAVTEAVHEKFPDIPAEAVVMNATHSHTAMQLPDGNLETPDGFKVFPPEKTRAHVLEKILEAVGDAYENRTEGGIAYGYGYAVVGHSRRVTYCKDMSEDDPNQVAPNGHAIMYGKTNLPEFIGYEAGADHFVNLMYTFDANDRLTGMIINVPCPSQTSENIRKMSADYWNEVRNSVAETFGEDVYVLPQCAAAGDLSPRILHYGRAQQRRMELKYGIHYERIGWKEDMQSYFLKSMAERYDIAERIMDAVKEVYAWAKKDIQHDVPVRHIKKTVEIHRRTVTDEEADWCRRNVAALNALIAEAEQAGLTPDEYNQKVSKLRSYVRRNERAIERNETEEPDAKMNTVIHTVEVGDVAFTTTRFELYMDYMHRIQARSPFLQTFVIQLAGEGGASYLATKRAEANRGYSASIFCNMASSEGGQELVEETLSMLEEMKAKDVPKA